MQPIRHVQAADCLSGEQIMDVLQRYGWKPEGRRSYITDVGFVEERVRRSMGNVERPRPEFPAGDPTGIIRFGRGTV